MDPMAGIGSRAMRWALAFLMLFASLSATGIAQEEPKSSAAAVKQYRDAVAFQNRGVYDLAADEWEKFLANFAKDPLAGKAQHYLGVCQLQLKNYDAAVAAFNKAIADYPASDITEQTYLNLGLAQYSIAQAGKSESYDQAVNTFATLIAKYPKSPQAAQALFYQGESLYARGKKTEAEAIYARFTDNYKDSPVRPDALYALGVTQEELDKPTEAGETYELFLKEYPESALKAEVIMRRGETLFALKQFAEAEKRFAQSASAPDFKLADHALVRQAASLYEQKKYPEAAQQYSTVVSKYPQSQYLETATLAAGNCYYLAENYPEARKFLQQVIASKGDSSAEAAHWLAKVLLKEKKPADAVKLVEEVLPKAAKSPYAVSLMMDKADAVYEIPERRGESPALYAAIAKEFPDSSLSTQALYMAGFSALGQGQYAAALEFANTFLNAHADSALAADVAYVAAEANLQLAKYPAAESMYKQLLEKHPKHAEVETWMIRLGLVEYLQKKYAETVATLTPLVSIAKAPEVKAEAQYLIGSAELESQHYDAAVRELSASLRTAPKWRQADETLLNLAAAYKQLNRMPEASDAVRKLLADFPNSKIIDRAHYRLGEIAAARSDWPTATAEYKVVLEKWPQSPLAPHALYALAWAQLGKQDYAAATPLIAQFLEKYPDHPLIPRVRYARAIVRQQNKAFAAAAEDIEAFLKSNPSATDKADANYVLGLCLTGQQKNADAIRVFNAVLTENPRYTAIDKVLYELAWALKAEHKDADATAAFTRLVKEKPTSPLAAESLYHMGEAEYAAKDYAAAAKSYYAASEMASKANAKGDLAEKAAHKLGWAYYQQGIFDKAQQAFEYQTRTFPAGELAADAQFMMAESWFKQNKYDQALAAYQKSLAKPPANNDFKVLVFLHAGQSAAQLKKWEESIKLLNQAIKTFADSPYLPELRYELGWAFQNANKRDDALRLYDQVAVTTEREVGARARFMMGGILVEKKDYKEALRNFMKVTSGYGAPDSPEPIKKWQASATYEAARCLEAMQRVDQAKKMYLEVVEKFPTSDKAGLAKSRLKAMGS